MTERSVEMLCSMLMLSMLLVLIPASSHGGFLKAEVSCIHGVYMWIVMYTLLRKAEKRSSCCRGSKPIVGALGIMVLKHSSFAVQWQKAPKSPSFVPSFVILLPLPHS
jgi:hypothetical protein